MKHPEKGPFAKSPERMPKRTMLVLGGHGIGDIGPKKRIENGEITTKRVNELAGRLHQGEFYARLDEWQRLPNKCVDGRGRSDGRQELGPNSAGGSFSLVAADMLTHQEFRDYGGHIAENTAQYAHNVFQYVKDNDRGHELGDHCDNHAKGEKSGCGAVDKMQPIMNYIANHPEAMHSLAGVLGVHVPLQTHDTIISRADDLDKEKDLEFSPGSKAMDVLRGAAGEDAVEELKDSHDEVLLSVNTRPGTTLNRAAIQQEFGDNYQAFNVDVWALQESAAIMADGDEAKAGEYFAAMVYYNIATACVLGHRSLEIVQLK